MLPVNVSQSIQGSPLSPGGSLRYPKDAISNDTDYVRFNFYDYKSPFADGAGGDTLSAYNNSADQNGLGTYRGSVILYMPEDIQAEYGAQWSGRNISNIGRGALGGTGKLSTQGDIVGSLNEVVTSFNAAAGNATQGTAVANIVKTALSAAQFDDLSVNNILSLTGGKILNPNTELIYDGPQMRNFSLNFKMAPKNQPEASEVKKIITAFKQAILPKFNGDTAGSGGSASLRAFIGIPMVVDVSFMTGGTNNRYVSQYKPSVLTNVNVSYTPDGAWATYEGGSPVATSLSLSFMELKMVYSEEIYTEGASY